MSKISKALERAELERLKLKGAVAVSEEAPTSTATAEMEIETAPAAPAVPEHVPAQAVPEIVVDERVLALYDPRSPVAEQYRILRTNLLSLRNGKPIKVVMLSSAMHSEGKSISCVNLAITLANDINRRKVLLIDADMRAGTVNQLLGIRPKLGLSDVLANDISWTSVLVPTPLPNLMVLPRGTTPPHPAELLSSNRMHQVMAEVRTQYDICLVDSPPIVPLADPGIIGTLTDGAVIVIRGGKTQRTLVQYAVSLLTQANVQVLGSILTHSESQIPEYLYRYF